MPKLDNKKWFYHKDKQNVGPCSGKELQTKIESGEIQEKTYVWQEGMENWQRAGDVKVLKSFFGAEDGEMAPPPLPPSPEATGGRTVSKKEDSSSSSVSATENRRDWSSFKSKKGHKKKKREDVTGLSALNEINPEEIHDISSQIDRSQLRKAQSEANKVNRQIFRETFGDNLEENKKKLKITAISIGVTFVFLIILNFSLKGGISGKLQETWMRLSSPIAVLPEVSGEDYGEFQAAATADLAQGVQAAASASSEKEKPEIYVASNLPDGANLKVHVFGKNVHLQLPLTIKSHVGNTEPVRLIDGSGLPPGDYQIILVEDRVQQSEEVKKILSEKPSVQYGKEFGIAPGKRLFYQKMWKVQPKE